MILEYLNGAELFEYIVRNKKLCEREARIIFSHIISGIDYLHKVGVVHRDLKPENVMVNEKGVFLFDFGSCMGVIDAYNDTAGNVMLIANQLSVNDVVAFKTSDNKSIGKSNKIKDKDIHRNLFASDTASTFT